MFLGRASRADGFLSCAHWLNWRTGIDLGAAREKVRVARALATLPLVSAALQRGTVSYAKVRAITRVATPDTEQRLLEVALAGTASHVERIVRAWRRVDRVIAAEQANARHLSRHLTTWVDDDGMLVVRGRLTPEVGAVLHGALEAAADQLYREAKAAPDAAGVINEVSWGQRRADALGRLAEVALAADLDAGTAGDRYQVSYTWTQLPPPKETCRRSTRCSTVRWRWTTRPFAFPRKRRSAWPAMPAWS